MNNAVVLGLIGAASNVSPSTNPEYGLEDFYTFYPQFRGLVPDAIVTTYIAMAAATVLQARWNAFWGYGMANFIAHFLTLHLKTAGGCEASAADVVAAALPQGLINSESVGEVSVSYDQATTLQGIERWATWNQTQYGQLFAERARLIGKGGMYIY